MQNNMEKQSDSLNQSEPVKPDEGLLEQLTEWVTDYKDVVSKNALAESPKESADYLLSLMLKEVEGARLKELPECDWDMLNDLGDGSEESTTKIYAKVCLTAQLEAVKKILGKV